MTEGPKWASLSKTLRGRNENSVKNRYLSLLGFHSSSRKKNKISNEELQERLNQKISQLKSQLLDEKDLDCIRKIRSELCLNNLCSEDCIKELSIEEPFLENKHLNNKINDRFVTFSEDIINTYPTLTLGKFSTKESISKQGYSNFGSADIFPFPEPKPFKKEFSVKIGRNFNLSKNLSEKKIDFNNEKNTELKRETSFEENFSNFNSGRLDDDSRRKSSFYNNSLSKSFSKLSFTSTNQKLRSPLLKKKQKIEEEVKESNNESKSWSNKSEVHNFDSISSISKKTDQMMIMKENSATSILSLSEIHNSKSFFEKSNSVAGSSFSNKEKKFLMSALYNLQSDGSKSSNISSFSRNSKKRLERRSIEEENTLKY